jgi:hypothetical protein
MKFWQVLVGGEVGGGDGVLILTFSPETTQHSESIGGAGKLGRVK